MSVVNRAASVVVDTSRSPHALYRPLPVSAVRLEDTFWAPRIRANRDVSIPAQLDLLERTGRLANFRRGAGKEEGRFEGLSFNDSDVYKWLEAASWALATDPDPGLGRRVDDVIREVADAQQPDGYLDTFYTAGDAGQRWTELTRTHELYCAGHLIQAAVAHRRATGKTSLLDVARRFADHICDVLGPAEAGKQPGTDGHPEIEMAMVELARETGDRRYLDQARYFLDVRGRGLVGGDEYHQDHRPFRGFDAMVGHAVRILYLNAGAADVYAETGDPALLATLERLWQNTTRRRMYVTGGLGARHEGEAFGDDYELPNARAYTETCAAIGSAMWNWRMLLLTGEAKYADLLEWTLYNAFLPGLALDGRSYFYVNPLADEGRHRRRPWFACACCPPNVARTLASVAGYFSTVSDDGIQVHLYAQGTADISLPDGRTVRLRQRTRYPWDGDVALEVDGEGEFALSVRLPAWCENGAAVEVNGEPVRAEVRPGSYVRLQRTWLPGDVVRLRLPMPARLIEAHPRVVENAGRWAVARGPLVYCVEQVDHPGVDLDGIVLSRGVSFATEERPSFLGGVVVMTASGREERSAIEWGDDLYRSVDPLAEEPPNAHPVSLMAIPYYVWANREAGAMRVWLRHE
ncbi:MAG: uncharacterized protein QOJ59_2729 [Thermomicrobiales bacterium]|nr:uncharacterized protein [Thermomicrobiales bacterium]